MILNKCYICVKEDKNKKVFKFNRNIVLKMIVFFKKKIKHNEKTLLYSVIYHISTLSN